MHGRHHVGGPAFSRSSSSPGRSAGYWQPAGDSNPPGEVACRRQSRTSDLLFRVVTAVSAEHYAEVV
jgi:hypothetical protein